MSVQDKVVEIIVEQLNVNAEQCVPEAKFIEDLGADSLDIVDILEITCSLCAQNDTPRKEGKRSRHGDALNNNYLLSHSLCLHHTL